MRIQKGYIQKRCMRKIKASNLFSSWKIIKTNVWWISGCIGWSESKHKRKKIFKKGGTPFSTVFDHSTWLLYSVWYCQALSLLGTLSCFLCLHTAWVFPYFFGRSFSISWVALLPLLFVLQGPIPLLIPHSLQPPLDDLIHFQDLNDHLQGKRGRVNQLSSLTCLSMGLLEIYTWTSQI